MLRSTLPITAIVALLLGGAAHAQVPLAAPGDCAQPRAAEVAMQPVQALPVAVSGGASDHFGPSGTPDARDGGNVVGDLVRGLPGLTSTRTSADAGDGGIVRSVTETAGGLVGGTLKGEPIELIDNTLNGEPIELIDNTLNGEPIELIDNTLNGEPIELIDNTLNGEPIEIFGDTLGGGPIVLPTDPIGEPLQPVETITETVDGLAGGLL